MLLVCGYERERNREGEREKERGGERIGQWELTVCRSKQNT